VAVFFFAEVEELLRSKPCMSRYKRLDTVLLYLNFLLYRRIRRPHLGLKFFAISLLNPVQVEDILIEHKINEGLIVNEVNTVCCCFPEFACFLICTKD
jgi:hypothetical protein